MLILRIFPYILLRKSQILLSVASAPSIAGRPWPASPLKQLLLHIYLIYNILRRIVKFLYKHTCFLDYMLKIDANIGQKAETNKFFPDFFVKLAKKAIFLNTFRKNIINFAIEK